MESSAFFIRQMEHLTGIEKIPSTGIRNASLPTAKIWIRETKTAALPLLSVDLSDLLVVLGVTFTDLVVCVVGKHFSNGDWFVSGQFFKVIGPGVHLAFSDSLGKCDHAVG